MVLCGRRARAEDGHVGLGLIQAGPHPGEVAGSAHEPFPVGGSGRSARPIASRTRRG